MNYRVLLTAALAATIACGPVAVESLPEDPAAARAHLATCPTGDAIWREALGRAADGEALIELATDFATIADSCPDRWEPAWAAGESNFRAQRFAEARPSYEQARSRALATDSHEGIACAANRLGSLALFRGELDGSERLYREALESATAVDRNDLRAFVLNNLAALLKERGDLASAVSVFREAAGSLEELGLDGPARQARYNHGVLLFGLGAAQRAAIVFEQAKRESDAAEDSATASAAAVALGNVHMIQGRTADARGWYEQVDRSHAEYAITADIGLGRAFLEEGRLDEAAARLDAASRLATESEFHIDTLIAETYRGDVDLRRGDLDAAKTRLRGVIAESDRVGSAEDTTWFARYLLGEAELQANQSAEAVRHLQEAVRILESQRGALDPMAEGMHFLLGRSDPYASLALAHTRAGGSPADIATVIEQAHARALRRAVDVDEVGPDRTFDLAALQARLAPDEALLDYLIGREASVVLLVRHDRALALPVAGWEALEAPLRRYRSALQRPLTDLRARARPMEDLSRDVEAGHAVREGLLDPALDQLAGVRRLYVVPDRELALLPFAALPDASHRDEAPRFLGDRFETATLPLAGAPPTWDRAPRTPVLLGGDPAMGPDDELPALARAGDELSRLSELWGSDHVRELRGDGFTVERFADATREGFRTIHLATHAVASTLDPDDCAVLFSSGEKLGFHLIARLELGPALVVLSACRTGEGELVPGEGVVGLGWAFLVAGSRGLVVSLWSVEDAAAADLMTTFHQRLQAGDDPTAALSTARRTLREQRPHPAYWSPFTLVLRAE